MELIVIFILLVAYAQGHSCRVCDKSTCLQPTNCKGGVSLDACRCCLICARQEGESCGGWYGLSGACDNGLKCVTPVRPGRLPSGQEIGTCKSNNWESDSSTCRKVNFEGCDVIEERCVCSAVRACVNPFQFTDNLQCRQQLRIIANSKQNCSNHKCEKRETPNCPPDSEVESSRWPAGECCPLPPRCRCRRDACKPRICPRNYDRVLVKPATGESGSCCNYYKCKPKKYDCSDVICPAYDQNITCPADSTEVTDRKAKDGCCMLPPRCRCKSIVCTQTSCPDGSQALVVVQGDGRSGTCCDEIKCVKVKPEGLCEYEGKMYMRGQSVQKYPCISCECLDGVFHCSRERCPILGCASQYTPEGRCCPKCKLIIQTPPPPLTMIPRPDDYQRVCTGYDGKVHLPGSVWFPDDCTRCVCGEDGRLCTASACQSDCANPRKVEGRCCGVCDEPTIITINATCPSTAHCNLTGTECPYGFKSDSIGCRVCQCREKSEVCGDISRCKRRCPNGYETNELGCETCRCKKKECGPCTKQCAFGFRTERGKCSKCKCRKCANIGMCDKKCKYGKMVNKYGCKICKCRSMNSKKILPMHARSCVDGKIRYDDGEEWKTSSKRQCVCRHGEILCDMLECPIPHCDKPIVSNGSPCAVCPDSPPVEVQGLTCTGRADGETWDADSCTPCVCVSGRVMCSFEVCAPVPCAQPVFKKDHCCPTCPDSHDIIKTGPQCFDIDGKARLSGSSWRRNKCVSCTCDAGVVRCFGETCPQEHNCPNPVVKRDQCCPQCLDEPGVNQCLIGDKNYTDGEIWSISSDNCEFCLCMHGNTLCQRELCRPLPDDCKKIIKRTGECCSVCDTTETISPTTTKTTTTTIMTTTITMKAMPIVTSTIPPAEIDNVPMGMLPIIAGVGGAAILLIMVAIVAFYGFKKRKITAKSPIYKAGTIRKSAEA